MSILNDIENDLAVNDGANNEEIDSVDLNRGICEEERFEC